MAIIIKTYAICTECTEARAKAVVDVLKDAGFDITYGGVGHGSKLPENDAEFSEAFYKALDKVDYNQN